MHLTDHFQSRLSHFRQWFTLFATFMLIGYVYMHTIIEGLSSSMNETILLLTCFHVSWPSYFLPYSVPHHGCHMVSWNVWQGSIWVQKSQTGNLSKPKETGWSRAWTKCRIQGVSANAVASRAQGWEELAFMVMGWAKIALLSEDGHFVPNPWSMLLPFRVGGLGATGFHCHENKTLTTQS